MRAMRLAPKRVKTHAESLDLTAEQIAALDQLVELSATAHRDLMATARAAAEKLTELFDGETVDSAAVRAAALDAFEPQAAMHAQMLVDAAVVRGILTAAQRETVTAMAMRSPATNHCGRGGQ
jgi:Spy/CpxP family protein refolding chaperone